jgi:hypothetical protein
MSTPFPLTYDPTAGLDAFLSGVASWIASDEIAELFARVPAHDPGGHPDGVRLVRPDVLDVDDPVAAIHGLQRIADWRTHGTAWDTRDDDERQVIDRTLRHGREADEVIRLAERLGLRSSSTPASGKHTAFVALGGARLAPLCRTRHLAESSEGRRWPMHFVLLGAARELRSDERDSDNVREYALGARTEYDLMVHAGARWLGIDPATPRLDEHGVHPQDPHQSWGWQTWGHRRTTVHAVHAPTRRPGKRANTEESLVFTATGLGGIQSPPRPPAGNADQAQTGLALAAGDSVVLGTSAIYAPFQHLDAVRVLGAGLGCRVQTVAFPIEWNRGTAPNLQSATNYLQEIRSTFQAALRFVDDFETRAAA